MLCRNRFLSLALQWKGYTALLFHPFLCVCVLCFVLLLEACRLSFWWSIFLLLPGWFDLFGEFSLPTADGLYIGRPLSNMRASGFRLHLFDINNLYFMFDCLQTALWNQCLGIEVYDHVGYMAYSVSWTVILKFSRAKAKKMAGIPIRISTLITVEFLWRSCHSLMRIEFPYKSNKLIKNWEIT